MATNREHVRHPGLVACAVLLAAEILLAQGYSGFADGLARPRERQFILDIADMISAENEEQIRGQCDTLLTEKATPIVVVTIGSMREYGGAGMRIETFARLLFDRWQVGHATLAEQDWNTGILLLVSRGDRKARIELGAGWRREMDPLCRQIMQEQIIPRFKADDFSGGIAAGVNALDKMARGLKLPRKPRPWWHYALILGAIALAIFTVVSLVRHGSGGYAWLLWAAVFGLIGFFLYQMMTSRSSGGGGFSGGSFGGGFSGGGGATGSW